MKRAIIFIYFILFALAGTNLGAQDVVATVSRNKVGVGERFRLTYTIENKNIEGFTLPKLDDFSIVGGPMQGTSTQIFNNTYKSTSTISYDLVCSKPGKYTIPGGVLKSGGKTYTSNSVQVEITKEPQTQQRQQQQTRPDPFNPFGSQAQTQAQPDVKITDKDLFIVTSLSKPSVYPGEVVTVTYTLYSKFQHVNMEDLSFPEYHDAWINELNDVGDKQWRRDSYNGIPYNVAVIRKSLFIPQKPGDIDIKPVTAKVLVQFAQRTGNAWEDFFMGGRVRQERLNVTGNTVKLKVKDYPDENKPANFNGATGNFTMKVEADRDSTGVNDALTVKVTISGSGNLSLLSAPALHTPSVFEVYDPKSTESISAKPSGVSGSKTFEYLILPRSPGKYKLPPVEFSFFNPQTGKYNTLLSDTLYLKVSGDASGSTVVDASGKKIENLTDDIRYIKTNIPLSDTLGAFFPSVLFIVLFLLFLVATVVLWFLRTKIWDLRNDTDRKRVRVADSVAVKRLKKAEEYSKQGNKQQFYEACYKAVIQYLQDRLGLQLSEISGEKVKAFLQQKGVSETLCNEASDIISACEFARFSPPGSASELSDFHTRCIRFISNMEKK